MDGLVMGAHVVVKDEGIQGCLNKGAGSSDSSPLFSTGEMTSRHWVKFRLPVPNRW